MPSIKSIIGEDPNVILERAFVDLKQTVCHNDPIRVIINGFEEMPLMRGKKKKSIFKL